jgi:hypothetical protein
MSCRRQTPNAQNGGARGTPLAFIFAGLSDVPKGGRGYTVVPTEAGPGHPDVIPDGQEGLSREAMARPEVG